MRAVRNATQLVMLCENQLGMVLNPDLPEWKARAVEAGRVNRMRAKTHGVSWDDLALAVEYLRRRKQTIHTAAFLFYVVDKARAAAAVPEPALPLEERIRAAIAYEMQTMTDPVSDRWLTRLSRSRGSGRQDVYREWLAERGQP